MDFKVYVETGSSNTPTTLAFTIGATSGTRSWKVSKEWIFEIIPQAKRANVVSEMIENLSRKKVLPACM
jgi:hypothetical protein